MLVSIKSFSKFAIRFCGTLLKFIEKLADVAQLVRATDL